MKGHVILLIVVWMLAMAVETKQLPIIFRSSMHPHVLMIQMQIQPDNEFTIRSSRMVPWGNRKTRVDTHSDKTVFVPALQQKSLVFNQKSAGIHHIAFHKEASSSAMNNEHFHLVKVQIDQEEFGLLLPLFIQETPSLRTDGLFRCSNALISVEWKNGDAHIKAFSESDDWRIIENIDDGFTDEQDDIQYGYAVDKGHTHPIVIEIGTKRCFIDQQTKPAALQHFWNQDNYALQELLDIVGPSLVQIDRNDPIPDQL